MRGVGSVRNKADDWVGLGGVMNKAGDWVRWVVLGIRQMTG